MIYRLLILSTVLGCNADEPAPEAPTPTPAPEAATPEPAPSGELIVVPLTPEAQAFADLAGLGTEGLPPMVSGRLTMRDHVGLTTNPTVTSQVEKIDRGSLPWRIETRVTLTDDGKEPSVTRQLYTLDSTGLTLTHALSVVGERQVDHRMLPPSPAPGTTWTFEDATPVKPNSVSCSLQAEAGWCADGVVAECLAHPKGLGRAANWTRRHYCPGLGLVGMEDVTIRGCQAVTWTWSHDMKVGEQAVPEPDMAARVFPAVTVPRCDEPIELALPSP